MSIASADLSKRRRRGPAPLELTDKRGHCVSVRLNDLELAQLDVQRASIEMQRGEYLRAAALHQLPPVVPAINKSVLGNLAKASSNLNQIARHLNRARLGGELQIDEISLSLKAFRRDLTSASRLTSARFSDSDDHFDALADEGKD